MSQDNELKPTLTVVALGNAIGPHLPTLSSRQLFRGSNNMVRIEHGGQCYLLRLTRENKLILTK